MVLIMSYSWESCEDGHLVFHSFEKDWINRFWEEYLKSDAVFSSLNPIRWHRDLICSIINAQLIKDVSLRILNYLVFFSLLVISKYFVGKFFKTLQIGHYSLNFQFTHLFIYSTSN